MYLCLFWLYIKYIYCLIYFLLLFFYNFKNFFMFQDVPECSGMFHVPGFIDGRSVEHHKFLVLKMLRDAQFLLPQRNLKARIK